MQGIRFTGNMCQWFSDLLDPEIKEAEVAAENEHVWALGADDAMTARMHEDNEEELKQYADYLKKIKDDLCG